MSDGPPAAEAQNCDRWVTIRADSFTRSTATKSWRATAARTPA